ncbi:MAG TPA: putative Ig domain-containing protein [Bryobacteraceae bacterium]|nr:putative Ig domain-containing protein [Bryobacteraceae bacterium]
MNSRAVFAVWTSIILGTGHLPAQAPTTFTVIPSTSANTLAQSIVGTGVTIVGTPTLRGMSDQAGLFQAFSTGPFTNPVTNVSGSVAIPQGVILSSGRVQDATGRFDSGADASMDGGGDSALSAIAGYETSDAVSLEFSFIPDSDEIFIEYLFASTEYPTFVNSPFNDVFAFFVNGVNVAVVPGSNDPVTINKINAGNPVGTQVSNPQFFTQYSNSNTPFNYGGATVLLTARAAVRRGVVNTFRFAVADSSDSALDSAVFIGAGKFSTAPPNALAVSTAVLPNGQVQAPYSQTLAATGGTSPYSWRLESESDPLPPGLSLSSAGVIQGTPTTQGTYNFTVRVDDSGEDRAVRNLSITIVGQGPVITTTAVPSSQALTPYTFQFAAAGGTPPYTWALAGGSLPSGFSLTPSGVLTGTAGEQLSSAFAVRVTDSTGRSSTKPFTFAVAPRDIVRQNLEIATASLPDATAGKLYAMVLAGRNGAEPYSWSFSGLPEGLQGNAAGEILGTPVRAGSFPLQIVLTDAAGTKASGALTLLVKAPPVIITTERVPEGRLSEAYSTSFAASGGLAPYSYAVSGGSLPPGLSLASNGVLSGTPTQLGSFQFMIQATDSARERGSRSFGLTVRPATLAIVTSSLGSGTVGTAFSLGLSASGGTVPYTWSANGLPEGLSVNSGSGLISGIPTRTGTFQVSVSVRDQAGEVATRTYSMEVITSIVITSTLGNMVVGTPVSTSLTATGGTQPFTWSVVSGSLPAGLALTSEGILSGTPTNAGVSSFVIQARDATGLTGSKAFSVQVISQLVITTENVPAASFGVAYSAGLSATGGSAPYTWALAGGALPSGLTLNPAGTITGTPTAAGSFSFTAQVTDAATGIQTAQRTLTLQVSLPDVSAVNIDVPANPQAGQQIRVNVGIGTAYPVDITGTLNLAFAPNAANNADDPAIQFSTGGRSVPFTIPAGQTQAVFRVTDLGVQTGTTAGTITLSTVMQAAGAPVNCNCQLNQTIVIPRSAPTISSLRVTRTATGFNVVITGFSTSRELTQGTFRFAGASTLDTTELVVPLTATANSYFQSATGAQFGGQFTLNLPFTIQGNTTSVTSVTGTITNSTGTSQPVTATF